MLITTSKSSPFHSAPPQRQSGAMALVVGVILFFGATLIALYTTDPVRTEQQVTGNEYRAFQALNAAEAGLGHVQSVFVSYDPDRLNCGPHFLGSSEGTEPGPSNNRGSFEIVRIDGLACSDFEAPSDIAAIGYLTLHIEVEGRSDDSSAVRRLSQNVFLMDFGEGLGGLAPLNFAGDVDFDAPNSGSFRVNGQGGPAISLQGPDNKEAVENAIALERRADNYTGGISGGGFGGMPWDDPKALNNFVSAIEAEAEAEGNVISGNHSVGGNSSLDGVNVVNGDMEFSGNAGGSGVLVVKGGLTTAGTPQFDGLIIVLGGNYTLTGGGGGGQEGSIFVSNLIESNGSYQYGETTFNSSGGGNALFNYNFSSLEAARDLLSQQTRDLWDLEDTTGPSGPNIYGAGIQAGIIDGSWVDFE